MLLVLLILVLLAVLIIGSGAIGLAIFRGRSGHDSAIPSCGKCGYASRGLTTFTCPECGSDLREVGIQRASSIHSPMLLMAVIGIVVGVVLLFVCASGTVLFRWASAPIPARAYAQPVPAATQPSP